MFSTGFHTLKEQQKNYGIKNVYFTWKQKKELLRALVLLSFINKLYTENYSGFPMERRRRRRLMTFTVQFVVMRNERARKKNIFTKSKHTFKVIIIYFIRLLNTAQKYKTTGKHNASKAFNNVFFFFRLF